MIEVERIRKDFGENRRGLTAVTWHPSGKEKRNQSRCIS